MAGFSALRARRGVVAAVVAGLAAAAVVLALVIGTGTGTGITGSAGPGASPGGGRSSSPAAPTTTKPPIPPVELNQPGVLKGVQPWQQPVQIKVSNGTLLDVTAVDENGTVLDGAITGTSWTSSGVVVPSRSYQLEAYVQGLNGARAYHTLHVATSAAEHTAFVRVNLQIGPAVGVAWPITVHFTRPVANRAAVQAALQVQTSAPVTGAWHWFSDAEVHYRPKSYWPAHTKITLHRNLDGVEVSPGVWGTDADDVAFTTGDTHISTVNVATHHMTVTVNGHQVGDYKVSTGRPSLPTLDGVHIVLEKWASIEMKSSTLVPPIPKLLPNGQPNKAYYDEKELWATRISYAGAFVHFNPATLKVQGISDASHGCINTNLQDAEQFYNLSRPGDVVDVINSPAAPDRRDPGMADWNYTWAQWLAGGAARS